MRPRIPLLAACVAAALATATVGGAPAAKPEPRPNIVVIETDDQTAESLRVMANVRTLLAEHGTTFVNSFVANSLCCPSRATFLTGQYSHNSGIYDNHGPQGGYHAFRAGQGNTLPVWLRRVGYTTIQLGKYLNGYPVGKAPAEIPPGWDEWHASVGSSSYDYYGYTLNENGVRHTYAAYQTDLYARKAASLIAHYGAAAKPYFFWICFVAPHAGLPREADDPVEFGTPVPARRHKGHFSREPIPHSPAFNEADVSDKPIGIGSRPPLGPGEIADIVSNYRQHLETQLAVDEAVAKIVGAIARTGELSRTLIVFTSDNGFLFGEHRVTNGKILPYEPSIRVPLVVRGPGVPEGVRLTQDVSNIDLAPTFVDAANARAGRLMDGRSLLPLLANRGLPWRRDLLIERGPLSGPPEQRFTAIRTPRFLYAEYANGERELYELLRDPDELTSVHNDPAYSSWRADLAQRLARLASCRGPSCRG